MSKKLISFIIPHKGREHFLQQTIESIIQQDYDLSLFEIIVVTQNEKLSDEISFLDKKIDLSIFHRLETKTISHLRNFGVRKSHGDYLAFLDADIALSTNWSECMLQTLKDDKTRVIVSGSQVNSKDPTPLERIRTALSTAQRDRMVDFLPGCNLFLSKEVFNNVGGFPENLISCEDYYFSDQASTLGILYRTSKATYVHLGEDRLFNDMYKKEIWRGQSNLQSIRGRSIKIAELPSLFIPVTLLFMFIFFLVTVLLTHYILAITSLLLLAIIILLYTFRLYKLTNKSVGFTDTLKFYLFYFPARAVGTIGGLFKTLTTRSHSG